MKPFGQITATFLLLCAACLAEDEIVYKAYSPKRWPSPEQIEALKQLAGEKGKVIPDRASGKVMVLAASNAHAQVSAVIAALDVPVVVRNVRIDITSRRSGSESESGFSVQGSGRITSTREGTGFRVKVKPTIVDESGTSSGLVQQTVVVLDGEEGSIVVAQEVPHFEWLWEMGQSWGYIPRGETMREVGSFLTIRPVVEGNGQLVRLKLTPELRGVVGDKPRRIQFTKVSTEVTVQNGASFPIGGLGQDAEFSKRFLVGFSRSGQTQSLQITVRPTILGADGQPAP